MKRIGAYCFAGILVVLVGTGAIDGEERQGPRLLVKEERHDFGTVVEGTKAVHLFELRNEGDEPLAIDKVHAS